MTSSSTVNDVRLENNQRVVKNLRRVLSTFGDSSTFTPRENPPTFHVFDFSSFSASRYDFSIGNAYEEILRHVGEENLAKSSIKPTQHLRLKVAN